MTETQPQPSAPVQASGAGATVRRIVIYTLLLILVITAAIGLAGLLGRPFDTGGRTVFELDNLSRSLAFALIAGPLALVLWWLSWRRLSEPDERRSIWWGLYLTIAHTISLITATVALLSFLASLLNPEWTVFPVGGFGRQLSWDPYALANALVWALVWVWHRWMLAHRDKGPVRMRTVPIVLGWVFGLSLIIGGSINLLSTLVNEVVAIATNTPSLGAPWWVWALQALIWAAGGALVWWLHWYRDAGRTLSTVFNAVALVIMGILLPTGMAIGGTATVLYVLLTLVAGSGDPLSVTLWPLAGGVSAALIGALVLLYHRSATARESVMHAGRLAVSGAALAGAATGVGIVINATLAAITPALYFGDPRSLLFGGIAILAVSAPVWWLVWRRVPVSSAKRVYLIVVFGVSALVALITLLVIGYQLFVFFLDPMSGAGLVDSIRAPLGILVSTVLVSWYHFAVWRHDRGAVVPGGTVSAIGRVLLVTADHGQGERIREATGAKVTVLERADAAPGVERDVDRVVAALEGVSARHVLVLDSPSGVQVVDLKD
ncbi:DUF5671 domain-containing protein [Cryobacterium sp. BB736]|uniref:DUF5671 domain-containing protein n=1 Tax=Cryobacterium sp. BB736 TaxID=2746963 RepID=UPI00187658C0|nr:DUF5671 domain-containing protein [Cryobacterium sp. BB736]